MIENCPYCNSKPSFIMLPLNILSFGCTHCDKMAPGAPGATEEEMIKLWNQIAQEEQKSFIQGDHEVINEPKQLENK